MAGISNGVSTGAIAGVMVLTGLYLPSAADAESRFSLSGYGTLSAEAAAQTNGTLQMKASLSPAAAPAMQAEAGRFALSGVLNASSLVCYNDTIYRNDFDGDGF